MQRFLRFCLPSVPDAAACIALLMLGMGIPLSGIDNLHFYRANFWWGEPRFERSWLTTFDMGIGGGSTSKARNCKGNLVPLFDIYGPQNIQYLGLNVCDINPNNPLDQLLLAVQSLPANPPFGFVQIHGGLSLNETFFDFKQNFRKGFFLQLYLPLRSFSLRQTRIADLSPSFGPEPNAQTPAWRMLLNSLDQVLALHGVNINGFKKTGLGDLSISLGWTRNYQETKHLDYIDWTIKLGSIIPTSPQARQGMAFDIPTGYNGHGGISVDGDASIGVWEWLTVGANVGGLWLFPKTHTMRVRTSPLQSGPIKLARAHVRISPGTYWHAGCYVKGDHFNEIFSLAFGYSFNQKTSDRSSWPISDPSLRAWSMHTFHVFAELDFANRNRIWHPRISIFFNTPLAGKRIFDMAMGGAAAGIDITWLTD